MIYLFIDTDRIKALSVKKGLLGQYDINFYEKKFQLNLINDKNDINSDVVASAVKEIVTHLQPQLKDKEVTLILPQQSFTFDRTEIPTDITANAIMSFLQDKIKTVLLSSISDYVFDYFPVENGSQKQVNIYALEKKIASDYLNALKLVDLKVVNIIPDTLAYFKLFEKTLRKEKKENIAYAHYQKGSMSLYLYDSYGLTQPQKIVELFTTTTELEKKLKLKATKFINDGKKINRLILSGIESESIRQDTFTKNTGMWTNPLKKIATNFYQEYLKVLITPTTESFSVLSFDVCFGAFILSLENKNFSLLKNGKLPVRVTREPSSMRLKFKKEYLIFIASFIVSFAFFVILSKLNIPLSLPSINTGKTNQVQKISPTVSLPTPTPTPSVKRDSLKIKVLNGGGVKGKATDMKDILQKAGYKEVLTGNADNFDYTQTVIQVKKTSPDLYTAMKHDIADYVTNPKQDVLDSQETADIVVIIGQDFK